MIAPRACRLWPDCRCMAGPCPELSPQSAPPATPAHAPLLSREETIERLTVWAADMLTATPPRTGALHLLDAIHYLRAVP